MDGRKGDFHAVRLEALEEVGPAACFSLLVIAVAFLPIFALVDQEGRLFKPLAYSKNLAMAIAALLAITLDPACRFVLRHPKSVIAAALLAVGVSVPVYFELGSEFTPPLNESTILYTPTTVLWRAEGGSWAASWSGFRRIDRRPDSQ